MHDVIVFLATMFAILPDSWSFALMGGELILNGDGSFITGARLSERIY